MGAVLFIGGKETPLAGAQVCFLPPKPPIHPPTRFYQEDGRFGDADAFFVAAVPPEEGQAKRICCVACIVEHFLFETLCVSNHTACRFAEKRGFSTHFWSDGAVPPLRALPFSEVELAKTSF